MNLKKKKKKTLPKKEQ